MGTINDSWRKFFCVAFAVLISTCGWTAGIDMRFDLPATEDPNLGMRLAETGFAGGFAADSECLVGRFDEQGLEPARDAWGWTADDVRFGVIAFGDPTPRTVFRPLDSAVPVWPGMRMDWDYEALSAAGPRRFATGALPLAAVGLLLLASRRWA